MNVNKLCLNDKKKKASEIDTWYWLVFIRKSEKSSVLPTMQLARRRKLVTDWTTNFNSLVSSRFVVIVVDVSDQ